MVEIFRPVRGRIQVHGMPRPQPDEIPNRYWFQEATGRSIRPTWQPGPRGWDGHWEIAREHLTVIAQAIAIRYGSVRVVADYSTIEQCDARCQNARGDDCTCSCEGRHHGAGTQAEWREVAATTLIDVDVRRVERVLSRAQALREAPELQSIPTQRHLDGS